MDKKELIQNISRDAISKSVRGKNVWVLYPDKILHYYISRPENDWIADELSEPEFKSLTCPLKYMELTPSINNQWREQVRKHHQSRTQFFKEIKQLIKKGNTVTVFLKEGWKYRELILESYSPLLGRVNGVGKLYEIPVNGIKRYEVIENEQKTI